MSIEHPIATKHHRDMTEKLLKATVNPKKQTYPKIGFLMMGHIWNCSKPVKQIRWVFEDNFGLIFVISP